MTELPRWIFGYGSLVWRPAFPFAESSPAFIEGYARRFWQGSTDHRGVVGAPGRVVTLIEQPNNRCWGRAYRVENADFDEVIRMLDHREKGGYERRIVPISLTDRTECPACLVYLATAANDNYLGPASVDDIAEQVASARGPSGANVEYVLRLAAALAEMGASDLHVEAVAEAVRRRAT